jgi:hypothetical protein
MEIDATHIETLRIKYFYRTTITNMAAMQNFEVISGKTK